MSATKTSSSVSVFFFLFSMYFVLMFLADVESLVFLYQLVRGIAQRSYGLNVARLAGMPETLLKEASARSKMMEDQVTQKRYTSYSCTEEIFSP